MQRKYRELLGHSSVEPINSHEPIVVQLADLTRSDIIQKDVKVTKEEVKIEFTSNEKGEMVIAFNWNTIEEVETYRYCDYHEQSISYGKTGVAVKSGTWIATFTRYSWGWDTTYNRAIGKYFVYKLNNIKGLDDAVKALVAGEKTTFKVSY